MSDGEELLRPADLAKLLGVSRSRVYQLLASGVVPAVRVGGAIRIPRAAWEEWLRGRTAEALASLRETSASTAGNP
jgi:excisionase family DNA binding protein